MKTRQHLFQFKLRHFGTLDSCALFDPQFVLIFCTPSRKGWKIEECQCTWRRDRCSHWSKYQEVGRAGQRYLLPLGSWDGQSWSRLRELLGGGKPSGRWRLWWWQQARWRAGERWRWAVGGGRREASLKLPDIGVVCEDTGQGLTRQD